MGIYRRESLPSSFSTAFLQWFLSSLRRNQQTTLAILKRHVFFGNSNHLPNLDDMVSSGSPKSMAFASWSIPINTFQKYFLSILASPPNSSTYLLGVKQVYSSTVRVGLKSSLRSSGFLPTYPLGLQITRVSPIR